jgi:hypothetical protein
VVSIESLKGSQGLGGRSRLLLLLHVACSSKPLALLLDLLLTYATWKFSILQGVSLAFDTDRFVQVTRIPSSNRTQTERGDTHESHAGVVGQNNDLSVNLA